MQPTDLTLDVRRLNLQRIQPCDIALPYRTFGASISKNLELLGNSALSLEQLVTFLHQSGTLVFKIVGFVPVGKHAAQCTE